MKTTDRRSMRRAAPRTLTLLATLLSAFVLAACGAASGPGAAPGGGQDLGGAPGPVTGDDGGDQPGSLADQRIIKTGEISIEVPDVTRASARVRAMAIQLDGYVGGSQAGTRDEPATLTLRINGRPAIETAVNKLGGQGDNLDLTLRP